MSLLDNIERMFAPIRHKIATVILKGILDAVNDGTDLQVIKAIVGDGELQDGLERVQQYGFTSVPEKDAEVVVLSVNGNRNQSFIIAVDDHRYRLKSLSSGEVAIYSKGGNYVKLSPDGTIKIYGDKIEIGKSTFKKLIHEDIFTAMNAHTHGGVAPGGSVTGTPVYVPPLSTALHATTKTEAQ